MEERKIIRPVLRKSLFGYRQMDVDEYITRTETEMNVLLIQQEKHDDQMEKERAETQRIRNILDSTQDEKLMLIDQNEQLNLGRKELERQLWELKDENTHLKNEIQEKAAKMQESDHNPELIKKAIISAHRIGDTIIEEATAKGQAIIIQAEAEANRIVTEAEKKRDAIQKQFDDILREVSDFKARMIQAYQRNLDMVQELPDIEKIKVEAERLGEEENGD